MRVIGLLKTAAIGDTVLISAVIEDLRFAFPEARLVLFVTRSNEAFAKRLVGVEVTTLTLQNPFKSLALIWREKFDLFFDFDAWPRISALFAALALAQLRIGFKTAGQHRHFMFDLAIEHSNHVHEMDNYRSLIKAVGVSATAPPQTFGAPWIGGENTIVFHMWPSGTKSHLKEWPAENWVRLATLLRAANSSARFVLTGGPEDRARSEKFVANLSGELQSHFSSAAGVSFNETLELLRTSQLLVSVNTGIMHVGAAMGVPTVGLQGPTNPLRWGPLGARTRAVSSAMPGAGQLNLGFEYQGDTNFMTGIAVEDVAEACQSLVKTVG